MTVKVTERVLNMCKREAHTTTVSKVPHIAQIDWIKARSLGDSIKLYDGFIENSDGDIIGRYEFQ